MVEGKHNKPEEIKYAKKAISEASDYSDIGTKERVPQFGKWHGKLLNPFIKLSLMKTNM
jgi:hypothetical protein